MTKYLNRRQAGSVLAESLVDYKDNKDVIVLALPRGGVPVAYEVAKALHVQLDVYLVRKLGVPGYQELAMGAIAQGGVTIFNQHIMEEYKITPGEIDAEINHESVELQRREIRYRGTKPAPSLRHKIVIIIDDGIATGATIKAAIQSIRQQMPSFIIAAVPVADNTIVHAIAPLVDAFVCPLIVDELRAVGSWYEDFAQTEDQEVHELLNMPQSD